MEIEPKWEKNSREESSTYSLIDCVGNMNEEKPRRKEAGGKEHREQCKKAHMKL